MSSNIVLKDKNGNEITYNNISNIQLLTDDGTFATFVPEGSTSEQLLTHADIPDYIKAETRRVANLVESVRTDDSIVFLAMSDNHHYGEQQDSSRDSGGVQTNTSNTHSAMAAKILAYALKFDFMAHLGDITWGSKSTSSEELHQQGNELLQFLRESHQGIPCFHAIGNHDTGIYYHNEQINSGNTGVFTESGQWLYDNFTALSESADTVCGGAENGGYCYRDFPKKKLRVFLLNTSEALIAKQEDEATLGAQRKWFVEALEDLNNKTDASNWSFLVLSHYPADYGNNINISQILKSYVEGLDVTVTLDDGTQFNSSFTNCNNAKFIAQFHGHVHNFLVDKLSVPVGGLNSKIEDGKTIWYYDTEQYDAIRVCIPNGQYNRENYYTTLNTYPSINFAEQVSYNKTPATKDDTSFVVNVINPDEETIHSFVYGAGIDRKIGYGKTVYHRINLDLSNATVDNPLPNIEDGLSYQTNILPAQHCAISSVTVLMDDIDVTESCYNDGRISISQVTGNIDITVKAKIALACTNQIPISTDDYGVSYGGDYDEDGSADGYKIKTFINGGKDAVASTKCATGFIPAKSGDIIRMRNMGFVPGEANDRIAFYDKDKTFLGIIQANSNWFMSQFSGVLDENNLYTQFTLITYEKNNLIDYEYIRLCCSKLNSDSILTVNEEIQYVDELEDTCNITYQLDGATSSNTTAVVSRGSRYSSTITIKPGYVLNNIVVRLNDVDITADVLSNNIIDIHNVTGNIEIIVTTDVAYTNWLPLSVDASGNLFEEPLGYKYGDRLNSSGNQEAMNGSYVTGFIPVTDGSIVRLRNIKFEKVATTALEPKNQRISFYDVDKKYIGQLNSTSTEQDRIYDGNNLVQFTVKDVTNAGASYNFDTANAKFFRMNAAYIGEDSIITVDTPIE